MTEENPGALFDREADCYDAARPTYPEALFDALAAHCGLSAGAPVVEIGAGTGQATEPLARRGYVIRTIEQGPALAALARKRLGAYPNVTVVVDRFEACPLPKETFELVVAATAFHWIDKAYRFTKPHQLLAQGGHLAIIHTEHVSDGVGDHFFEASQPIYRQFWPEQDGTPYRLPTVDSLMPTPVEESLFEPRFFKPFPQVLGYSSQEYTNLLRTYSPVLALTTPERARFLDGIEALIQSNFNDRIEKHVTMTLTIARRREVYAPDVACD